MLHTITGFSKQYKIERNAVKQACIDGKVMCSKEVNDKGKYVNIHSIDDEHQLTKEYIVIAQSKYPSQTGLMLKQNVNIDGFPAVKNKPVEEYGEPAEDDLPGRYQIANVRLKEEAANEKALKNAVRRGELIEREQLYFIFLHIDKLHSNLERLADSYLADVAMKIIDSGKLTSEVRAVWKNAVFEQIDDTKKWVIAEIKKIEENQKG